MKKVLVLLLLLLVGCSKEEPEIIETPEVINPIGDIVYIKDRFDDDYCVSYFNVMYLGEDNVTQNSKVSSFEDKTILVYKRATTEEESNSYSSNNNIFIDVPIKDYDITWLSIIDKYLYDNNDSISGVSLDNKDVMLDIDIEDILHGAISEEDNRLIFEDNIRIYEGDYADGRDYATAIYYNDSYLKEVLSGNLVQFNEDPIKTCYENPEFIRVYGLKVDDIFDMAIRVTLIPYNDGTVIDIRIYRKSFDYSNDFESCSLELSELFPYTCDESRVKQFNASIDFSIRYYSDYKINI